jgi:sugar phosphate isomerase/epimerase
MLTISRRQFFKTTGAGAAAITLLGSRVATLKANPLGLPIGSQTYPHRARIVAGEFAALLKDMKSIGIDQIELCDPLGYGEFKNLADGKATKKMLDDAGIKAVSCHVGMNTYRTKSPDLIKWAHDVGLTQLSTADLGGTTKDGRSRLNNGWTTEEAIKDAADEYNQIAANNKKEGFAQVLHNEAFALSHTVDGRMTYPLLIHYLDPALVGMQFQMSAMTSVGDPIAYFNLYPGRFWSAHLQGVNASTAVRVGGPGPLPDKNNPPRRGGGGGGGARPGGAAGAPGAAGAAAGAPAGGAMAGGAPPTAGGQAPAGAAAAGAARQGGGGGLSVGEDTLDWPRVFEAAKVGGMKNFFVEQTWDLTVKSVAYLKTLA